jgi:hypothetical protein
VHDLHLDFPGSLDFGIGVRVLPMVLQQAVEVDPTPYRQLVDGKRADPNP